MLSGDLKEWDGVGWEGGPKGRLYKQTDRQTDRHTHTHTHTHIHRADSLHCTEETSTTL